MSFTMISGQRQRQMALSLALSAIECTPAIATLTVITDSKSGCDTICVKEPTSFDACDILRHFGPIAVSVVFRDGSDGKEWKFEVDGAPSPIWYGICISGSGTMKAARLADKCRKALPERKETIIRLITAKSALMHTEMFRIIFQYMDEGLAELLPRIYIAPKEAEFTFVSNGMSAMQLRQAMQPKGKKMKSRLPKQVMQLVAPLDDVKVEVKEKVTDIISRPSSSASSSFAPSAPSTPSLQQPQQPQLTTRERRLLWLAKQNLTRL